MKTFEQYNINDEKEMEELFLEIAHLDELEAKFYFIEYPDDVFYYYKNDWIFCYDKDGHYFWISVNLWGIFRNEHYFKSDEIKLKSFMYSMIEKHFKLEKISIAEGYFILKI
ncbi:hypothetical protein M0Q50_02345 [bacterium]|jgi:hypothetical protein|nr:hypothetical protein [bacterium]